VSARGILGTFAILGFGAGMFFAGMGVERSHPLSVPASVPVIGDKPTDSLVRQDGQPDCSTRMPSGYTKDEGCPVAEGKGFTAGFHTVRDGWAIRPTSQGPVLTLTVVNDNPGAIAGFWHTFHLERYDGSLVEIVWCETPPFAAGESKTVTCRPLQPEPSAPYSSVHIVY
jgi:hypothetical protein